MTSWTTRDSRSGIGSFLGDKTSALTITSELRDCCDVAGCAGRKRRQQRVGGIRHPAHGAVAKEKIHAAAVVAPKVEGVALVRRFAGPEMVRPGRATVAINAYAIFADAQNHFRRSVFILAPAGIPPAEDAIGAGRPFPSHEGVRQAIAYVGETRL